MNDFSQYGDPSEEWTRLEATLPAPSEQTQEELKKTTNQWREDASRIVMQSLSSKVTMQDHSVPARDGTMIEARSYRSSSSDPTIKLPIYIHYHGGGFFFGTLASEDALCARIAIDVPVAVVNVNYRHTPEFKYPTAWYDSEDAFHWVYEHADAMGGDKQQIVVGGISAGGQLAAALAQTLYREQAPSRSSVIGQVLMIPCVVHEDCYEPQLRQMKDRSISSYVENEFAPILPVSRIRMFNSLLHTKVPDPDDRRMNPGNAIGDEAKRLPPATFGICGLDPLRDEALLYAMLLHDNGVPVDVSVFKGVPHGFSRFGDKLSVTTAWNKVMHNGIRWALSKPLAPSNIDIHVY